jgi:hypothetical protein
MNTVKPVPAAAEPAMVVPAGADPVVIALAGRVPATAEAELAAVIDVFVAVAGAGRVTATLAVAAGGAVVGAAAVGVTVGVATTGASIALLPPQAVRSAVTMSKRGIGHTYRRCIPSSVASRV